MPNGSNIVVKLQLFGSRRSSPTLVVAHGKANFLFFLLQLKLEFKKLGFFNELFTGLLRL